MQFKQAPTEDFIWNIQPYLSENRLFQAFVISSIITLFLITLLKVINDKYYFEYFVSMIRSEQQSFDLFSAEEDNRFINILIVIFCSLQLTFLFLSKANSTPFEQQPVVSNFLLLSGITTLFFLLKFFVLRSLEYLLPWRINIRYYIYTYRYALFLASILLFAMNASQSVTVHNHWAYFLIPVALFYCWLLFRWLFISMRYKVVKSLYFFLYLCTLEIAPLIILWKAFG